MSFSHKRWQGKHTSISPKHTFQYTLYKKNITTRFNSSGSTFRRIFMRDWNSWCLVNVFFFKLGYKLSKFWKEYECVHKTNRFISGATHNLSSCVTTCSFSFSLVTWKCYNEKVTFRICRSIFNFICFLFNDAFAILWTTIRPFYERPFYERNHCSFMCV